jgi:hypothetical protein
MTLGWNAVSGAVGYHVFRNGVQVDSTAVTGTSYVDSGLSPATPTAGPWPPWTAAARGRALGRGERHHHRGRRHLLHRQQLRAHHGRPGPPERRLHLRQRLQPGHGPVERVRHHHAEADGANYYVIGSCP